MLGNAKFISIDSQTRAYLKNSRVLSFEVLANISLASSLLHDRVLMLQLILLVVYRNSLLLRLSVNVQ